MALVYLEPWAEDFVRAIGEPPGFRRHRTPFVHFERDNGDPLKVIVTARVEADGKRWVHVSFSHRNRTPTWETTALVKRLFLGDRKAIAVLPPEAEYVNIHPFCLHLWCCLDGDGLPDFRVEGMI